MVRLSSLDLDRQASMADEGGVSGALVENQEGLDPRYLVSLFYSQGRSFKREKSSLLAQFTLVFGLSVLVLCFLSARGRAD